MRLEAEGLAIAVDGCVSGTVGGKNVNTCLCQKDGCNSGIGNAPTLCLTLLTFVALIMSIKQ